MSDLHKTEDRADLEQRYRLMAQMFLAARKRTDEHLYPDCESCAALREGIDLKPSVWEEHGPREDVEDACEAIADALGRAVENASADHCPAALWLRGIIVNAETRRDAGDE